MATSGLTRVLTLWCADWPVAAAVRTGVLAVGSPAVVIDGERVIAVDAVARAAGVRAGQRRRIARRAAPDAAVLARDRLAEARAFEAVVQVVGESCPRLEVIDAGWLALDIRGPARHFGGEEAFVAHLTDLVTPLLDGVRFGIGLADGRVASAIAARRAARAGSPVVVAVGGSPAFLAPLALDWFRAVGETDADTIDLLRRLGIRTAGDLAALDGSDVLTRFGPAGARLHTVVSGDDHRRLHTVDPGRLPEAAHPFDEPVTTVTPVVFAARRLAEDLVSSLAATGTVCTRVTVIAETTSDFGNRSEEST